MFWTVSPLGTVDRIEEKSSLKFRISHCLFRQCIKISKKSIQSFFRGNLRMVAKIFPSSANIIRVCGGKLSGHHPSHRRFPRKMKGGIKSFKECSDAIHRLGRDVFGERGNPSSFKNEVDPLPEDDRFSLSNVVGSSADP